MAVTAFQPSWLSVDDVKNWLRLNQQDTSDDDLLASVAAMAEPYVMRCRPEWRIPATPDAALRLDAEYYTTELVLRIDEWQKAYPDAGSLVDQRGHLIRLGANPTDDWGIIDPNKDVQVLFADGQGTLQVLPLQDRDTGNPITGGEAITWLVQRLPVILQAVGDTHFTASTQLSTYLPDAETYQGAVMYAAREYRRRNSPAGIETFGEVTSFVARFDPDIDRALQTGAYARPVVS